MHQVDNEKREEYVVGLDSVHMSVGLEHMLILFYPLNKAYSNGLSFRFLIWQMKKPFGA